VSKGILGVPCGRLPLEEDSMTSLKVDVGGAFKIIKDWKAHHKLSAHDADLLLEACRRFNNFGKRDHKTLSETMVGLGGVYKYGKSLYFSPFEGRLPPPRCLGWWVLTEPGKKLLSNLIAFLPWREELNSLIFTGDLTSTRVKWEVRA